MFLVDSHCHLDLLNAPINDVLKRAEEKNVKHILNVSINLKDFNKILKTAETYPNVSASVGLHPNDQDEELDETLLLHYAEEKKVIAIGETGLDYFRVSGDLGWQQQRFRKHIAVAKKTQKPLIVHTRQAQKDTLEILQSEDAKSIGGVMHCFGEDWDVAKKALDLNFYISFSGIATFKNAKALQDVIKRIPLDRLLLETDAPYLAPEPYRGKSNEPAYLFFTAQHIAMLRNEYLDDLANATTRNFFYLFKGANQLHV